MSTQPSHASIDVSNDHVTSLHLPVNAQAADEKVTMVVIEQMQAHIGFVRYQFFLKVLAKHWPAQLESIKARARQHGDLGWVEFTLNWRNGTTENTIVNKSNTFRTQMDRLTDDGFAPLLRFIDRGFDEGRLLVTSDKVPTLLGKVMDVSLRQRWLSTVLPEGAPPLPRVKL